MWPRNNESVSIPWYMSIPALSAYWRQRNRNQVARSATQHFQFRGQRASGDTGRFLERPGLARRDIGKGRVGLDRVDDVRVEVVLARRRVREEVDTAVGVRRGIGEPDLA